MIQIPRRWEQWAKALMAAIVGGMANSFLSALGISAGQAVGIKLDSFTPKQLLDMTIMGGLVGMFMYLKQSPVPPDSSGDTQQFTRPQVVEVKPTENTTTKG